jgi:hypothetical protein
MTHYRITQSFFARNRLLLFTAVLAMQQAHAQTLHEDFTPRKNTIPYINYQDSLEVYANKYDSIYRALMAPYSGIIPVGRPSVQFTTYILEPTRQSHGSKKIDGQLSHWKSAFENDAGHDFICLEAGYGHLQAWVVPLPATVHPGDKIVISTHSRFVSRIDQWTRTKDVFVAPLYDPFWQRSALDTDLHLLLAVPTDSLVRLCNRLLPLNRWTHTKTIYTVNGTYQWLAISSFSHHTPGRWKVMHARREKPRKSVAYLQIDDIEVRVIYVKLEKISPKAASPQP